jgi:LmeA-like phospholipid-binding
MTQASSPNPNNSKVRIITKVLTSAIKLWLRSQLNQVSHLEVQITASDRQLLSGCIPGVSISASNAVYQGLHVTQVELRAENIQLNVASILKGQPLQLSAIVPVFGKLIITEDDLNNSLSSPLLLTAINDVLITVLAEYSLNFQAINWRKITLDNQVLILHGIPISETEGAFFNIYLGLELLNGQELQLTQVQVKTEQEMLLEKNSPYMINLGTDVDLERISLIPEQLSCYGRINVNP